MTGVSDARWIRIKGIVADAIELEPPLRPAWVERACGEDRALRDEVEALVQAYERAGTFLDAPALAWPGAARQVVDTACSSAEPSLPERFGAYRVLGELGRGGMGVVYLGARDDDRFDKQVAIKVVYGDLVRRGVLRRFEDERRILASLDHPNIARLLDAGTTGQGTPYLVMERIEGDSIDGYCGARGISVPERLRLFLQVCAAVQYSHQHLVVHRDIKARNILVTADGVPKLLDFGIAKLLEAEGTEDSNTRTAFRVLTPESASPEQVRGEPVSVATDVYSLGVLLYRLLTGLSPYRGGMTSDPEIVRAICEEEPLRPSDVIAAGRELRGDLDLITLKALRKDPTRRYTSVEGLARDIQRHLDRLPVLAAPDSWTYRAGKFVARRWMGLAAVAAVAVALLAGGAATWWQKQRAERRFNDLRRLAHTVMFDVHDAVAQLPGSTAARKLLVTEALEYLDSLALEEGGDPSLQRELATGYEKMADVLGRPFTPNLGDVHGALASYQKAQAARERLLAREPGDADVLRDLSSTSMKMSRAWYHGGDPQRGVEEARRSAVIEERLATSDDTPGQRFRLARSYGNHGFMLYVNGRTLESLERLQEAVTILEQLSASSAASPTITGRLAVTYGYLAAVFRLGQPVAGVVPDLKAALDLQRKAVALDASLSAAAASDTSLQRQLMIGIMSLGEILEQAGEPGAARDHFRQGVVRTEQMARSDPANLQAQKDYAWASTMLGQRLARDGDIEEAFVLLRRAARTLEPVGAANPADINSRSTVALVSEGFGYAHARRGSDHALARAARKNHWQEARARFREAYAFWTEMRDKGVTTGADLARPKALALEIARCDAALTNAP